jgi:hypothetical protein
MSAKVEHLERTILELGSELFRLKHRMDEMEQTNVSYNQVFTSLKKLLDDKGIISADDFEDVIALDKILNLQSNSAPTDLVTMLGDDLKKVVN